MSSLAQVAWRDPYRSQLSETEQSREGVLLVAVTSTAIDLDAEARDVALGRAGWASDPATTANRRGVANGPRARNVGTIRSACLDPTPTEPRSQLCRHSKSGGLARPQRTQQDHL